MQWTKVSAWYVRNSQALRLGNPFCSLELIYGTYFVVDLTTWKPVNFHILWKVQVTWNDTLRWFWVSNSRLWVISILNKWVLVSVVFSPFFAIKHADFCVFSSIQDLVAWLFFYRVFGVSKRPVFAFWQNLAHGVLNNAPLFGRFR